MKLKRLATIAFTTVLMLVTAGDALAFNPQLSRIMPRGGQRGSEMQITLSGSRLGDALEVLFYDPGIQVLELKPQGNAVNAKIRIAADCPLGQHIMRVRCAGGVSEAQTLYVGPYPNVDEKEPNSDFTAPQTVAMNSTVQGVVQNEDVDYYLVEAKKGDRISAEVEGMRLGVGMFDPYVAIMDMKRFELSAADDTALLLQDCYASAIAPEDGTYVIQVREASYGGNGNCIYRLHIGNFPRPKVLFPAGGKAGTDLAVQYLGDVTGPIGQTVKLPTNPGPIPLFAQHNGQIATSPNTLRVSNYDNILEAEPNNDLAQATKTDQPLPLAFNGVIQQDDDIDWFRFQAKKGQSFDIRIHARSVRSPLDAVLYLRDASGKQIAANDDSGGPDSYLRWTVPNDGEYLVGVRDHLGKGGPQYVYRIEFEPVVAALTINIPEYTRYSQDRNTIDVPRGNRYATLLRVNRGNFGGDVVLGAPELPQGVTMVADTMASNINVMPVVFEAAADAPVAGKLMALNGAHADSSTGIIGGFAQTIGLIYGSPGQTEYYTLNVDRVACAVAEEAPFKISVVQPQAPLVKNGSMNLKVIAERAEGFKGPITLRMLWNPPGVGSAGSINIPEGQNEANYPLNANGGAQVRTWKIAVVANADGGKGNVWVSSQLTDLTIAEPFLAMKIEMAATEQGQPADLVCKLNQLVPFEGHAKVILHGLPANVAATTLEKEITKDDKEVVFNLTTSDKSPVGQHKTLFCQVIVTHNGEPVVHNVGGGGVLRVDPPPPPKKDEPKPVAVAAPQPKAQPVPQPAPPAPPKRLSRLEQLRLEAQKRAEKQADRPGK